MRLSAVAHRTHPRVRGGYAARSASLVFGLFLFAVGIVMILESKLGLSPWDVLNQACPSTRRCPSGWRTSPWG